MEKTILVTGGAGYVGFTLVEELAKRYNDRTIVVYDNLSKARLDGIGSLAHKHKNIVAIPWEQADIRDAENFEKVLKEYNPEIVVHLAAIVDAFTTNRKGKDLECEIVNHESAVNIAILSKKNGVKIFIFQSSVSVYSRGENIDEEAPKDPLSTYGKTKMRAEKGLLEINSPEFKVVILRPATVVGYNPAFRYETIINLMCIRSLYKMPINIFESAMYGNKTYTYLKDNAAAIIFAIENANLMNGQYYNVSSFNVNLDTVLKILKRTLKEDFPYYMTPQKTISQHVYTVSSEKISKLGFKPEGNIEAVIQESIANLKKQRSFFHGMSGIY